MYIAHRCHKHIRSGNDLSTLCKQIIKKIDKLNVKFNANKLSRNKAKQIIWYLVKKKEIMKHN